MIADPLYLYSVGIALMIGGISGALLGAGRPSRNRIHRRMGKAEAEITGRLELKERFLEGSGAVSIRYFLTPSEKRSYLEILVIRYSGHYPHGSGGNADARYMAAMAKAAVAAFEPSGVIHDLSNLRYEWGDKLLIVFDVGPDVEPSPVAVVVGPGCEKAVRTLCLEIDEDEPLDWLYRDMPSAWRYISDRIGSFDASS